MITKHLTTDQILLRVIGGIVATISALCAVAVMANNYSPDAATIKAKQDLLALQTTREAQYQKCVVELWPIMQARVPYDNTGHDLLGDRSYRSAYLNTLKEQASELCSARNLK